MRFSGYAVIAFFSYFTPPDITLSSRFHISQISSSADDMIAAFYAQNITLY